MIMKKTIRILLAALALSSVSSFAANTLDRVIAIVNEDVVMESQLQSRLQQIYQKFPASQLPPRAQLEQQILDRLIEETLELEVARRAGVHVTEQELQQTIGRIAAGNNMTIPEFEASLVADGTPMYAAREQIRREVLLNQVQQGAVGARIRITEQEITNYLNSEEGKKQTATSYNVAHILIPVPANADSSTLNELNEQALEVYNKATAGDNFAALARSNSKAPDALEGGQLGWRKIQELPSLFANHVEGLREGQVSEPFRSGAGYHIIKLQGVRGADNQVIQQTQVRHILVAPNAIRTEDDAREQLLDITKRYKGGEDFAALAKEFSEDYGSARKGGDLGWSNPGMFVPQFEQTMNSLKIGELSEPFRSQFGWHILEVTGRRDQNMSQKFLENQAENFLRSRKFYDELPRWRQELRDEAYIEIKAPYNKEK